MKIKALEIYGFGKLENIKIDSFSSNIQVFYGNNEAGKSTLMAFIHAILFGFPTKNQTELRYEPKKGFKYGGKLLVETHDGETVTIERIAGKAIGDVKVVDNEGNNYPLEKVLNGIDKSMYKGIFSFNIMDVQNLKLIDVEQLGSYLFSSGLIGTDQLQRISDQLSKSLDEQFKPGGRKPIMNKLLLELKNEEKEVHKWQQKLGQYEALQKDIQTTEDKLQGLEEENEDLTLRLRQVEAMLAMQPIWDQLNQVQLELGQLGDYPTFPVDGIARLEKWLAERSIYETKLKKLEEDRASLQEKLIKIEINGSLLGVEERIENLSASLHKHEQANEQIVLLRAEKQRVMKRIQACLSELSWDKYTEEQTLRVDTSLAAKAQLKELLQTQQKLSIHKNRLDEQFQQAKEDLEQLEEQIKSFEKEQLPADEFLRVQAELKEHGTEQLEREIVVQEQLLVQLEKQLAHQQVDVTNAKKQRKLLAGISVVIGGIGAIMLGMQDLLFVAILCFFVFTAIGAFLFLTNTPNGMLSGLQKDIVECKARLSELKGKLYESPNRANQERNQRIVAKEEQLQALLQKERLLLSQSEKSYDRIILQFEGWEKEQFSLQEKLDAWMEERALQAVPVSHLEEAFELVLQLKMAINERKTLTEKINLYQTVVDQFELEVNKLLEIVGSSQLSIEEAFYYLKGQLQENKKLLQVRSELEHKMKTIEEETQLLTIQWKEVNKQVKSLLEQAKASTEEEFRAKNQQYQKATALEEKKFLVDSQLRQIEKSYDVPLVKGKTCAIWEKEKSELEKELREVKEEQSLLYQLKMRHIESVRSLEEGGGYSDVMQQFELSKSNLQQHARKWAVYATAQQLLTKTMEFYRTVKLPEVLQKTSYYFRFLTDEEYVQVYDSKIEPKLMVKHKNGLTFEPKELSQATVEQLYIALRFAVASVWSKQQSFPFMMDDSFVNFDKNRTSQALRLMKKLSEEGEQMLFFTCHEHLKLMFEKEEKVAVVNMEQASVPSSV